MPKKGGASPIETVQARLLANAREVRKKEYGNRQSADTAALRTQIEIDLLRLSPADRTAFIQSVPDNITKSIFKRILNTSALIALTKDEEDVVSSLLELSQTARGGSRARAKRT